MGRLLRPAAIAVTFGVAAALFTGAAEGAVPGVTAKTISLGSSGPLTGDATSSAGVLRGADAYFKYVNARGGVAGRMIRLTSLDDAGDPVKAVDNAKELVRDDKVFALFSMVGTDENLASRDFLNAAGVPQVFAASGATALGSGYARYPWTIGYSPAYGAEGRAYAANILATGGTKPRIAILYEADAFGRDLLRGFRAGLGSQARRLIVQTVGYFPTDADVENQVAQLKASGARSFCVFASGKFAVQALVYADKLGWHPRIYLAAASSSASVMRLAPQTTAAGTVSSAWVKDPSAPGAAADPGVRLAGFIIKKYVPGASVSDVSVISGMAAAYSFVDALTIVGRNLTRPALMRAITHLDEAHNPFLIDGIAVTTSPFSRFPVARLQLERWQRTRWTAFGPIVDARP